MKKYIKYNIVLLILLLFVFQSLVISALPLEERDLIDPQYKWDLNEIYPTWEEW